MPHRINAQQFEAVSALSPDRRLAHFIQRVVDWEEVWSLKNGAGWVLLQSGDGKEVVPFWPHPEYAQACAGGSWAGCRPQAIGLDAFLERWIPGLGRDGRWVSVFPTPASPGMVLAAAALGQVLGQEIETQHGGGP